MALDTKQKRGSVLSVGLPFRQWLADPDGTLAPADRLSVLRYAGAVAPGAAPVGGFVPGDWPVIRVLRQDRTVTARRMGGGR